MTEQIRSAIRVFVVDDQPRIIEKLQNFISGQVDITFHAVISATVAVESAIAFKPTVILQDLVMPECLAGLDLGRVSRITHYRFSIYLN